MSKQMQTVKDLANAVRGRRLALGLSQSAVAERIGASRKWLYEFEAGKPGAELGLVLAVLAALDLAWTVGPPDPAADTTPGPLDLDAVLDAYGRP